MLYLGVDGGGTKTAFMLIDEKGNILAETIKDTIDFARIGSCSFKKRIRKGIKEICYKCNSDIKDISYSCFGVPGLGDEIIRDIPVIEEVIGNILRGKDFICVNDVEVGWAGSLGCQSGIHLVAGTGSIGYGRNYNGKSARSSGWGHVFGDEGSAYWIGMKLINIFTKQSDGRINKTILYDLVRENFNLKEDFNLIPILYKDLKLKRNEIAKLAMIVYEAAKLGDITAVEIYKEAAYELSLIVNGIMKKLDFNGKDRDILISYSGGVFNSKDFIIKPLKEYILSSRAKLIKPMLKPVTGAAMYALITHQKYHQLTDIIARLKLQEDIL